MIHVSHFCLPYSPFPSQEFVSLSQFTDMLTGRGASKEDCLEVGTRTL